MQLTKNVKIGKSQIGQPAPLGWRRFERAFIIVLAPASSAFVTGLGLDDETVKIALLTIGFITSIVKGFGMFLGNGQVYADAPTENNNP